MHTIDITAADKQFNGTIKAGEYVAFWISEDGQSSMAMTDGSHTTAEEAIAEAQAWGAEEGVEGGRYEVSLVIEE